MGLTFAVMPWYFDILSFIGFGTILAVVFAFIPAFACGDMELDGSAYTDKRTWNFWWIVVGLAILSGYALAFCILAGWVK